MPTLKSAICLETNGGRIKGLAACDAHVLGVE